MYYKKRPELISFVDDFYRAHRSLAERNDQYRSEKTTNVTDKTCDSYPETFNSEDYAESEVDDPEHEEEIEEEVENPEQEDKYETDIVTKGVDAEKEDVTLLDQEVTE
ncbi:hypothetical protein CRYUN_Cryun20dG0067000 [Craigia yunnanensis]